jgi:nucleoprotein TPR
MRQSNEYRLQTDFRSVQNERAKLQQLIDNLNSVSAESEKSRSEERQRMEKRVEEAQRES